MTNADIVRNWYEEVWNKKNVSAIYDMFSKTAVAHGLFDDDGKEICGPEKFALFFNKFIESFPDINVQVEDIICEGDKVVSRCSVTVSHTGNNFPLSAERFIAPTGKKAEFSGTGIAIVQHGKIQEAWNHFDFLSMYLQLGASLV